MRYSLVIAILCLAGCGSGPESGSGPHHGGRYLGVGTYPAGRMWSRQAAAGPPANPAAATIADDEQIVVVVDSRTGEIRQCGNLSGHCIRMNPWSGQPAAVPLSEHAANMDVTENATSEGAPANAH